MTDQAISDIHYLLEHEIDPEIKRNIQGYLDDSRHDFEQLIEHRQKVDNRNISFTKNYQVYTQLIEQLLSVSEHLIHVNMDSKLINDISAINSILLFKEYMGQVRAQGMSTVMAQSDNIYSNIAISLLVGRQLNTLRVFHYSASNEQKLFCADYCDATINQQLLAQGFAHIVQEHSVEERRVHWFDFMSIEINNLKRVTDELIQIFNVKVHQKSQQLEYNCYILTAVITLFLLIASLFSMMLNCSIISPIKQITHALNCLAKGQYNIHFKESVVSDDISAIKIAYEKLRRKLLQVNIFQATVEQQKSEIEYRKSQQAHFEHLALTDALTGAVNRHQFNLVLADEIFKADNHKRPLTILILDIDHFKQVNDTFGHCVGDEVLIKFYQACKTAARASDVVARIGGEEFVMILPNTNKENAFQFAELLRKKIQKLDIVVAEENIKLTVSIGVSLWQKTLFSSPKVFIADADKLLYQAKTQGRNKVVTST
ncbi:MAG: diguanylate cyclase [Colwellia sp.]|nr:diguanylate cyclase [Colwellia sp.]